MFVLRPGFSDTPKGGIFLGCLSSGRDFQIREALQVDRHYRPLSNMPPKPAHRFVSIPASAGGRGGRGGRGAGRGSSPDEEDKDSMPLIHHRPATVSSKRKVEPTKEQPAAKKAVVEVTPSVYKVPEATGLISSRVAEGGSSSLRPKIYKQLTLPEMVPGLELFAKPRKVGF